MCLYTMVLMMDEHPNGLPKATGVKGDKGTSNLSHPSFLPLPQTVVSKVIEVQYPWHLQYHPGWTTQKGPDILDKAGGIKKKCK